MDILPVLLAAILTCGLAGQCINIQSGSRAFLDNVRITAQHGGPPDKRPQSPEPSEDEEEEEDDDYGVSGNTFRTHLHGGMREIGPCA
jgi:hypothetical protein